MGTNYYFYDNPPCECCGRQGEPRHIGKSSAGWCFSLRVYPDDDINTLDDWRQILQERCAEIRDEYGGEISYDEMIATITDRLTENDWKTAPYGHDSWTQFHIDNNSEQGPKGLLRHRLSSRDCIGHGEGTWDYIVSSFS